VSTARQELSIDVQSEQVAHYYGWRLEPTGIQWGGWFCDQSVSGKSKLRKRPAGAEMFARMNKGDHVLISKCDRAFRNSTDMYETIEFMKENRMVVHFMDMMVDSSTPVGELIIGILAHVAQFERSRIGERTIEAKRQLRKLGFADNHPPLGLTLEQDPETRRSRHVDHEPSQAILSIMFELRERGFNHKEICKWLEQNDIRQLDRQRKGRHWRWKSLYRLIPQAMERVQSGVLPVTVLPASVRLRLGIADIPSPPMRLPQISRANSLSSQSVEARALARLSELP
jgi:DNA invertase Pin-like site-specific DNA recombinase